MMQPPIAHSPDGQYIDASGDIRPTDSITDPALTLRTYCGACVDSGDPHCGRCGGTGLAPKPHVPALQVALSIDGDFDGVSTMAEKISMAYDPTVRALRELLDYLDVIGLTCETPCGECAMCIAQAEVAWCLQDGTS